MLLMCLHYFIVQFAAEQSEEMCNRLLRKSARNLFQMMDLVASRPLRLQNFLTSNVLLALSSLCFHAKRSCVREAFEDYKLHLLVPECIFIPDCTI